MGKVIRLFLTVATITSLISGSISYTTDASYASTLIPSKCFGNKDQGIMTAAIDENRFKNGSSCGSEYVVKCIGPLIVNPCRSPKPIKVKIVDVCKTSESCFIVNKKAFALISNPMFGKFQAEVESV